MNQEANVIEPNGEPTLRRKEKVSSSKTRAKGGVETEIYLLSAEMRGQDHLELMASTFPVKLGNKFNTNSV